MSKNIRLVALDMDGTLFNHNSQITAIDQKAIKEATAAGVQVVISTGRPYVGLPVDLLADLGIRYAITANGAAIYRLPEKECIFSNCMEPAVVCPILRRIQHKNIHYDAFIGGNGYGQHSFFPVIDQLSMPDSIKAYIKTSRTMTDNLADFIEEKQLEVQKITINFIPQPDGSFIDRDAVFSILSEYPQITYLSGGYHNLEFTKAGTTKGMGLRFLADHFGISITQTMACGDSQNDLDILKTAGVGVAMENAVSEVKNAADFVTYSNENGGVAHAIYALVL